MSAVVLLSGGQDSATCLFWAMREHGEANVHALTLEYNQRHWHEIPAARRIAAIANLGRRHVIANGGLGNVVKSLLVKGTGSMVAADGVPIAPIVPLRNIVFMSLAAAYATSHGLGTVVIGACETDAAAFPDCRVETIVAAKRALSLGLGSPVDIVPRVCRRGSARSDLCWAGGGPSERRGRQAPQGPQVVRGLGDRLVGGVRVIAGEAQTDPKNEACLSGSRPKGLQVDDDRTR